MSGQNAKIEEVVNQVLKTSSAQMDQGLYEEAIATTTKQLISNEIVEAKVNGYSISEVRLTISTNSMPRPSKT